MYYKIFTFLVGFKFFYNKIKYLNILILDFNFIYIINLDLLDKLYKLPKIHN
jgi:hypothetical protein